MTDTLKLILGMALFLPACFTHFLVRAAVSPHVPNHRRPGLARIPGVLSIVGLLNLTCTTAAFWLVIAAAGWWALLCVPVAMVLSLFLVAWLWAASNSRGYAEDPGRQPFPNQGRTQRTASNVPKPDALAQWRQSQKLESSICLPPVKPIVGEAALRTQQEHPEPSDAPVYPPIWSQAHALRQDANASVAVWNRKVWPAVIGGTLVCWGLLFLAMVALKARDIWTCCYALPTRYGPVVVLSILAIMVLHTVGPIASGVSLLRRRQSSRKRVLIYACASVTIGTISLLISRNAQGAASSAETIGKLLAFTMSLVFPCFLIVWFTRDNVKREVAAWQ